MQRSEKIIIAIVAVVAVLFILDFVGISFKDRDTDMQPFIDYHKERERELIEKDSIINQQNEEFETLFKLYQAKDTTVLDADKSELHDLLDGHRARRHNLSPGR